MNEVCEHLIKFQFFIAAGKTTYANYLWHMLIC